MKRIMLLALAPLLLSACETPRVTQEEASAVSYGPKPEHWQDAIRGYLSLRLTDPKTALVEFRTEPKKLYQRGVALDAAQYGWAVCTWVNDKNRQGAYDGYKPMTFFIRNERIVAANNDPDNQGPLYTEYARRQCAELGAPFKD
jgi:hypothetical protein